MTLEQRITLALAYRNMTKKEAAQALGMSRQNFHRKLKKGAFTIGELERICQLIGARFSCSFDFPDSTRL